MENVNNKKSFVLYCDTYQSIKDFCVEDKAILLDSIFQYSIDKTILQLSPVAGVAFSFIKTTLDRDEIKWERIKTVRKESGSKGGKQRQANIANASFAKQKVASVAVSVNDNVNENVNEINNSYVIFQDDKTIKYVSEKEIRKHAQTILGGYHNIKNIPDENRSQSVNGWFDNFVYWVGQYSLKQIGTSLTNFLNDDWGKEQTLSVFFKTTDSKGEPVDRIGDFLQK